MTWTVVLNKRRELPIMATARHGRRPLTVKHHSSHGYMASAVVAGVCMLCLHRCVSDVLALPCPQIQRKGHFVTYKTVCKLLYGGSVVVTGDMHDQSMIKSHRLARKHTDCGPTPGLTTLDNFFIT